MRVSVELCERVSVKVAVSVSVWDADAVTVTVPDTDAVSELEYVNDELGVALSVTVAVSVPRVCEDEMLSDAVSEAVVVPEAADTERVLSDAVTETVGLSVP